MGGVGSCLTAFWVLPDDFYAFSSYKIEEGKIKNKLSTLVALLYYVS